MISNPRQVSDERRHARQSPEVGFVTMSGGSREQRLGDLMGLRRRQLGFAARRSFACQRRSAALCPRVLPSVSDLSGYPQPTGYFRGGMFLGEQFARLLAALLHIGMVSCLRHATTILSHSIHVTLLCESQ